MRFLITGASGFVGSRLVAELVRRYGENGHEFVCISRSSSPPHLLSQLQGRADLKFVKGDIPRRETIEPYFAGTDVVFHVAGMVSYGDFDDEKYYRTNVEGTDKILNLSRKYRLKRVVNIGTAGIWSPTSSSVVSEETPLEERHNTRYTRSKYLAHMKTLEYVRDGLPVVTVLPVGVFGNGSPLFTPLVKLLRLLPLALLPSDAAPMSLIHVDDLADGVIRAFEMGVDGESYILSGRVFSLEEIMRRCGARIVITLPMSSFRPMIGAFDYISRLVRRKFYFNTEFLNFTTGGLLADGSKAERELGFRPSDQEELFSRMVKGHSINPKPSSCVVKGV